MDDNTRSAILGTGAYLLVGVACLATNSAEPLWLLVLVWLFLL